jgi:hypothetical protein
MVENCAAHCNAGFFPAIVAASGYVSHVGSTWLLLVLLGSLVVAVLSALVGAGHHRLTGFALFNCTFIST